MKFLMGYKTKVLSVVGTLSQVAGYMYPQYSAICNTVTAMCVSGSAFTLRDAVAQLSAHVKVI